MIQVTLKVKGMRCTMCEGHVADQLRKVEGVSKAKADRHKKIAIAIAEDSVDVSSLKVAIEAQGYEVGDVAVSAYEEKKRFRLFRRK